MNLLERIEDLKIKIGDIVEKRIREFEEMQNKEDIYWYHELCFCILTANTSAEMGIRVQNAISPEEFANLDYSELSKRLHELGYRFYKTRAKYIFENREYSKNIKKILIGLNKEEKREFLIKNLKGIGNKEASHFLRNVGYKDYAIIDKHIFKIMKEYNLTNEKNVNGKNYYELEKILTKVGEKVNLDLGRLDLYLWYMETGKVLK